MSEYTQVVEEILSICGYIEIDGEVRPITQELIQNAQKLAEENNLETYHPKNIIEVLPEKFTEEEFCKTRTKLGLKGNYKEHLKKLKQRHQIDFDEVARMFIKMDKSKA